MQKEMQDMSVLFISLGCDKNLVDAERMLGLLGKKGFSVTDDETKADVIIVNTCCFIGDAKEESIQQILEMARMKEEGVCKALVVTGCMAERYKEEVMQELPEVDGILGISAYQEIVPALEKALRGEKPQVFEPVNHPDQVEEPRMVTTGGHYAFLKIAEGCDKHCTYCIIPKIRGNYRSVPMEQLVREASVLAEQGVKELILVAQETTMYGMDLYGEKMLPALLTALSQIHGISWLRLQYCYPEEITDALIQAIKSLPKVCHYLDIPIQNASNRILKRMGRHTTREHMEDLINKLRKEIPDIVLRTTLITGFPGETEEEFQENLEFVDQMEFDRLGVFAYSLEEDTPAADMPDQISEEIKAQRRDELMALQQEVAFSCGEKHVGRELEVLIEGKMADEPVYVGRTYMDAPQVDGMIFVQTDHTFMSGDLIRVRVVGTSEYDLMGEYQDESTK